MTTETAPKKRNQDQTNLAMKIFNARIATMDCLIKIDCEKELVDHRMTQFRYIAERSMEAAQAFFEVVQ